ERRRVLRVAHQQVARAQCQRIGRARSGNPEVRVAETAQILHTALKAWLDHTNVIQARDSGAAVKRTRSPILSSGGGDPSGSKRRNAVRPINRQPPGEGSG